MYVERFAACKGMPKQNAARKNEAATRNSPRVTLESAVRVKPVSPGLEVHTKTAAGSLCSYRIGALRRAGERNQHQKKPALIARDDSFEHSSMPASTGINYAII
jgi:hypothetical protein